jgi:cyclic beta-1,2-glucan synthetase
MYRVAVEAILGLYLRSDHFRVDPTVPEDWPRFELSYRRRGTTYSIVIENPDGVSRGVLSVELDGSWLPSNEIPFVEDGGQHRVVVRLGHVDVRKSP